MEGAKSEQGEQMSGLRLLTDAGMRVECYDSRLQHAFDLLSKLPEISFLEPVLSAGVFGIPLEKEFFCCSVPEYTETMSLVDFERMSVIRFISAQMCDFLGGDKITFPNQAAVRWLNSVCSPSCVREAATLPIPPNFIRRWSHKKMYETTEGLHECDVRGFILPNLKVMFVDIGAKRLLTSRTDFVETMFLYENVEIDNFLSDLPVFEDL